MGRHWYIPAAILLVLLVAAFLVGWLQLALPFDTYGVVQTRGGGFEAAVVRPGGFTWRLRRLLPGALTLHRFPLASRRLEVDLEGTLASGEVYASLVPEKPDFSWEMRLTVIYRISPDALPGLAAREGLRPAGLADWYAAVEAEIARQVDDIALGSEQSAAIARVLPDRLPYLELSSIVPDIVRMPDRRLYTRLREAYLASVAAREQALLKDAGRLASLEAEARIAEQRHERSIAILTRYGELLEKYPALIRFLFLTAAGKLTPQDLQSLDILERLQPLE